MARFFCCFFLLFLCLPFSALAQNAAVTDLRITAEPGQVTRLAIETTAAIPYRSFALDNPPRLVIDLPLLQWRAAPEAMRKGDRNGYIKSYRKGIYQHDTLRLVLDLNRKVVVARQGAAAGQKFIYHFDLQPAGNAAFQQSVGRAKTGNAVVTTAPDTPTASPIQKTVQTALTVVKKPLIILDPGHGGVDPGALAGNGAFEKNITLAVAKEVRRLLEETGRYRVKMTRDTDIFIKLPDRVRIARGSNADMFISLHADTIARPEVQGASVYTLSDRASDIETAKLAERENAVDSLVNVDVGQVDADVADILIDLVTRDTMNQSKILAETAVGTFHTSGVRTLPELPHRSAGFAVLKSPDIPSVLIEMGYLSNRQEAEQLSNAAYRTKLASAVVKVIERYFNETSKTAMY